MTDIRAVKLITAKMADAIIEGNQGEDSVVAVEAELELSQHLQNQSKNWLKL